LAAVAEFILRCVYKAAYLPVNTYPRLNSLKKFLFYNDYFTNYFFGPCHNVEDRRSVLFDFMSTEIVHYISEGEIRAWFVDNELELQELTFLRNQSWGAVGAKREDAR
jgi:hypothetical protein